MRIEFGDVNVQSLSLDAVGRWGPRAKLSPIESHFALSHLEPNQVPKPTSIEVTWSSSQLGNLCTLKPIPSGSKGEWKSETVTTKINRSARSAVASKKSQPARLCFFLDFEAPAIVQFMVDRQVQKDER